MVMVKDIISVFLVLIFKPTCSTKRASLVDFFEGFGAWLKGDQGRLQSLGPQVGLAIPTGLVFSRPLLFFS